VPPATTAILVAARPWAAVRVVFTSWTETDVTNVTTCGLGALLRAMTGGLLVVFELARQKPQAESV
jgi:hypothetical protein